MSNIIVWSDLSEKERNKILEDHRIWLDSDGAKGERANLESANLESANLVRANLVRANLYSANLYSANLFSANLESADLESADLESANLESANLESANLKDNLKIKAIYQCGPQGSRDAYLVSFLCDDGKFYFSTGCQRGIEEKEFLKLVYAIHKNNAAYASQYQMAVEHCKAMLKTLVKK